MPGTTTQLLRKPSNADRALHSATTNLQTILSSIEVLRPIAAGNSSLEEGLDRLAKLVTDQSEETRRARDELGDTETMMLLVTDERYRGPVSPLN